LNPSSENRVFRVFEHAFYSIKHEGKEGKILPTEIFDALKSYAGDAELPYFSLTVNGIRFKQYVGALQVGKFTIEVLPKVDRNNQKESSAQRILIEMLRQSGFISVKSPTESNLRLNNNFILETYIQMFLEETWNLVHKGLIKTYHTEEGNEFALKGSLVFNRNIQKNIIHAERFYVRHTTYDREHPLNRILYKTINLISCLSVSPDIIMDIHILHVYFPELKDISVSDEFFQKIIWDRKTEVYRKAINIARLLLLNYHPDLSQGKNNVLALMFDMNDVWETWFTRRLLWVSKKYYGTINIRPQTRKTFWTSNTGERILQKPDIIVEVNNKPEFILDTKWKIVNDRPSEADIRQMFAYNKLFNVNQAFLVYPGEFRSTQGSFYDSAENGTCGLKFIPFIKEGKLNHSLISVFMDELVKLVHPH